MVVCWELPAEKVEEVALVAGEMRILFQAGSLREEVEEVSGLARNTLV